METYRRDGLTFDVRDSGPTGGPAVVCLHGFPQDATAFDAVTPLLVAQGFRVLAPDQRGYSPGARPSGRRAYTGREVVADVVALLDAAGIERAHVVGHDWGGVVAWTLASRHADRTLSLTALSTPHPAAMVRSVARSTQVLRSSYMAAFQVPWLPERMLLARDGARLRRALLASGLGPQRADHYTRRLLEPGALTAALGWYRAIPFDGGYGAGIVRVPTAYVYGRRDRFFAPAAVRDTGRYVRGPLRMLGLDAGHWVPEQEAARVADVVHALARRVEHPAR